MLPYKSQLVLAAIALFGLISLASCDDMPGGAMPGGAKPDAAKMAGSLSGMKDGEQFKLVQAQPGDEPLVQGYRYNNFGPRQYGVEQKGRKKYRYDLHQGVDGQYQLQKRHDKYNPGVVGDALQGALRVVEGVVPQMSDKKHKAARYPNGDFAPAQFAFPYGPPAINFQ